MLILIPSCYISYNVGDKLDEDESWGVNVSDNQPYEHPGEIDAASSKCPTVQVRMPTTRPTAILLIDSSYTMQDPFRETDETRWTALRNALLDPDTGIVKPVEDKIDFGLVFFGGSLDLGCPFESKYEYIFPASNNYEQIESAFPTSMSAGVSYTPTGRALYQVCFSLPSQSVAAAQGLGAYHIILATDGNPNGCPQIDFTEMEPPNDFASTESAARECKERGISVLPLSLADEIDQQHLQTMANIGSGRDDAVVYQPQDSVALRQDLENLIGTVSCRIRLDMTDGENEYEVDKELTSCNDNRGSVVLDGFSIPCGPNGWLMSGSQSIELQGQTCENYKDRMASPPTISFPCDVLVPIGT